MGAQVVSVVSQATMAVLPVVGAMVKASGDETRMCIIAIDDGGTKKENGKDSDALRQIWNMALNLERWDVDGKIRATSLDDLVGQMAKYTNQGKRIYWLEFWGHGYEGKFFIGEKGYTADNFIKACELYGIDRNSFCKHDGRLQGFTPMIWFRTCRTAKGSAGDEFMRTISDKLRVTVFAYEEKISYTQPGLCMMRPDGSRKFLGRTTAVDTNPFTPQI